MAKDDEPVPVTLHTVARRAGVSTATASRVFTGGAPASKSTRAKVLASAAALGYSRPDRFQSPSATRNNTQALVLADLTGFYASELVMGFESVAAELGQDVALVVLRRRHDASPGLRRLAERVDGLAIGPNTVPDSVVQEVSRSAPVIVYGRHDVAGCESIRTENLVNAALLTTHLLEHGRSHLVFVGDPESSPDVQERYSGFRSAHADAHLPLPRPPLRVPLVEGAGIQVADEVLRRRVKVDGLVCADDELALAILKRLQDNGVRLPDDLTVVGWGDVPAARYVSPGLTSVRQPIRDLGRLAAQKLQARALGGDLVTMARVLPSQLVIRSSCGCPPLSPLINDGP